MKTKKEFIKLLKASLKTSAAFLMCIVVALAACEWCAPFLNKLTLVSFAATAPLGSVSVSAKRFCSQNAVSSQIIEAQTQQTEAEIIEEKDISSVTQSSQKPKDAGAISEYAFAPSKTSSKIVWYSGAAFSNTSKTSNAEILKLLKQKPTIKLAENEPQVLIFHTHATESYEKEDLGYYKKDSSARTTDERYNMIRVGDEIAAQLKAANIGVIHDRNLYDHPSYNGAYQRSAESVKMYLKKYPSISVVLDVHRDAIEQSGAVRVKPTAEIDGKKAAQVMIIAGVDDGSMDYKNWKENMKFASALQTKMEQKYKGLTRAAMVCHRRYNMYLSNNNLLVEVGGHANTLDEAVYSGELIGRSLVSVLKEYGSS